jgi:hypothetical protein
MYNKFTEQKQTTEDLTTTTTPAGTEPPTSKATSRATTTSRGTASTRGAAAATKPTTTTGGASSGTSPTRTTSSCTSATSRLLSLVGKPGERQELVGADVHFIVHLEGFGIHTVIRLDGEVNLVDRTENLLNLANLGLILQIDTGIEIRNHDVGKTADHFILSTVHELANDANLSGRSLIHASATTTTTTATETTSTTSTRGSYINNRSTK